MIGFSVRLGEAFWLTMGVLTVVFVAPPVLAAGFLLGQWNKLEAR